ncbi:glycosyltransferase [Hymenobacter terrestris]|uniref:Glycosyltransferase n=1 Tax=Hymenobacter terrestris TaxID=2748310 RepID=A0ABX2Q7C3_9BACT|nr:glycosyltransferase [Hymenobacter terrestris]NVO85574.1 glycosyltransferase [Hymenobacter terrestris]
MPVPVDLVLPCYNPPADWAANLIGSMTALQGYLPEVEFTVHVVNDGSAHPPTPSDLDLLAAQLPRFHYSSYAQNHGKGYALRHGIAAARNPICLFTDIDFPYEAQGVADVVRALLTDQCDVAVGARTESYYEQVPAVRTVISRSLRFCTRHLLRLPVTDTQCGVKGFNQAGKALFLQTQVDRYLFDLEFLYWAARVPGLRVRPVPVQLRPSIVFSRMPLGLLLREGYNLLRIVRRPPPVLPVSPVSQPRE